MKLYKILHHGRSCSGGTFNWEPYLPSIDGEPGKWTPVIANYKPCLTGYHGTTSQHIMEFMHGNELYEVETTKNIEWITGPGHRHGIGYKFVTDSMRLVRKIDAFNDITIMNFAVDNIRKYYVFRDIIEGEENQILESVLEYWHSGMHEDTYPRYYTAMQNANELWLASLDLDISRSKQLLRKTIVSLFCNISSVAFIKSVVSVLDSRDDGLNYWDAVETRFLSTIGVPREYS